jgi:hypothetical protein
VRVAFLEALPFEHGLEVLQHVLTAADHHAVVLDVQLRLAQIAAHLAVQEQVSDAALVDERLTRHSRIVEQLLLNLLAEELVLRQLVLNVVGVTELAHATNAVHDHHLLELLVRLRVADDAHERRETRTRAQQEQALTRHQRGQHERTCRLLAHEDGVTHLDVLQVGRQRTSGHLDAVELEVLRVVRAGEAVGAHHRLAADLETQHQEVPVLEAQSLVTCGREAEQRVVPVVDAQHGLSVLVTHVLNIGLDSRSVKPDVPK